MVHTDPLHRPFVPNRPLLLMLRVFPPVEIAVVNVAAVPEGEGGSIKHPNPPRIVAHADGEATAASCLRSSRSCCQAKTMTRAARRKTFSMRRAYGNRRFLSVLLF